MSDKYVVGVDLGTGATKTALYRQDGMLVAEAIVEVPLHHPRPVSSNKIKTTSTHLLARRFISVLLKAVLIRVILWP